MTKPTEPDTQWMTDDDAQPFTALDGHFHRDDEPPLPPELIGCGCTGRYVHVVPLNDREDSEPA
ncbi:hypothetical protein GALL_383460 [mine drainage metagenome]|uniref:Uncharacterized protein n=1 Tax=mine drainage metagenome TaxID=410659 RepID=A0A1J5Q866_9ZZZZ